MDGSFILLFRNNITLINPKNKTIFTLAGLGFLFLHFSATFFYVAPPSWTGQRLKNYSGYYILPLFHQGWSLFAPAPMVNKKVTIDIITKDSIVKSEVFFDEMIEWHNKVRMGASGRFVMLQGNTLHSVYQTFLYLKENVKNPNQNISQFKESVTGKTFQYLIRKWVEFKYPELKDDEYKIRAQLVFEDYQNFEEEGNFVSDTFNITYGFKNK